LCLISKNTEKPSIVNSRDKTDNSLSSFCTVFDVYVGFRLAVLIEMHRYSSSNLKNYFGLGGGTCPLCPHGSAPARGQRYLASMFYWATSTASLLLRERWYVHLNNAAVQWGWTVETRPKLSFQISLTWRVSTRVRGVENQSLVQYWIKTVCCRSKDHFHWTAPLYPLYPAGPKSGRDIVPHTPGRARLRRPWSIAATFSTLLTSWYLLHPLWAAEYRPLQFTQTACVRSSYTGQFSQEWPCPHLTHFTSRLQLAAM